MSEESLIRNLKEISEIDEIQAIKYLKKIKKQAIEEHNIKNQDLLSFLTKVCTVVGFVTLCVFVVSWFISYFAGINKKIKVLDLHEINVSTDWIPVKNHNYIKYKNLTVNKPMFGKSEISMQIVTNQNIKMGESIPILITTYNNSLTVIDSQKIILNGPINSNSPSIISLKYDGNTYNCSLASVD